MSIRLRLIFWNTLVLAFTLAFFSVGIYGLLAISLTRQVDALLSQTAEQVLRSIRVTSIEEVSILSIPRLETFQASETYVQVFDMDGRLQGSSENLGEFNLPLDSYAFHRIGNKNAFLHETYLDSRRIRVLTVPILLNGRRLGFLQVATSMALVDQAQTLLLILLLGGGVVAVVIALIISAYTTNRALRPLRVVTETAQNITAAEDLSQRIAYVGPADDELGRMVSTFNRALTRIEHLFYAQRRFIADVSHELRTPLTTIRANLDLMQMMRTFDRESLAAIQSESDRMLRMVNDLLLLAQAEVGNLTLAEDKVPLADVLHEVHRDALMLAGNKLTVTLTEAETVFVTGDRDRLKQVLLNLVTNAIKYTPDGGQVSLGLAAKKGFARFSVSDTGPGIPLEDQPFIFNHFYRVEKSRVREKHRLESVTGAGLGLAIARWIVDAHGGRIQVVSAEGQGATFFVWLPLAKEGEEDHDDLGQRPIIQQRIP